jgi:hypothetical protein
MNYLFGKGDDSKDADNQFLATHRSTVSSDASPSSASDYAEEHDSMEEWLRENGDMNVEDLDVNSTNKTLAAKSKQAVLKYIESMVDEQVSRVLVVVVVVVVVQMSMSCVCCYEQTC